MHEHHSISEIAEQLMALGKGILAADESASTMEKRFAPIGVESTPENDRRYRDLLFTAPGIEKYLSGVILFDETIRQCSDEGTLFPLLLARRGILPGIKVDLGLTPLAPGSGEEVSIGLDTLEVRMREYIERGAHFTKWRSVIHVGDGVPTRTALEENARVLATYARIVQDMHVVPMVEPEVLFDGTHTLERSGIVIRDTLAALFDALREHGVLLQGLILKTSMALPGKESGEALEPEAIARETLAALRASVPETVGGVVFLSGGQTPVEATENLQAIAAVGEEPWPLSFSYSRAIEEPVLAVWCGRDTERTTAQKTLLRRLELNALARAGAYRADMEQQ